MAAAVAVVVVLAGLAVAGWHEHWPPAVFGRTTPQALTWSTAEAPLPADAAQTSSQSAALDDVACPGAQSCVAVGYYATSISGGSNGSTHGLIETFSHRTWTAAAAPVDVAGTSPPTFVDLSGVACPAQGACVAVGSYYDSQNIEIPLTDTLSGGTWTSAKPALPGDADQGKSAFLSEISCPAPGTCVATGWYTDQNGDIQAMIDTLSGGTWTAQRAPLPAGAIPGKPSSSNLPTGLFLVKCPAVGTCVATGDYIDQSGGTQGLIDTLSGGTWTAQRAPLPGDAAAANPVAVVWALACPAPGACLAGGHYNSRNGQSRGLIETQSGGTWTPAAAPLPAGAAADQKWNLDQVTGLTAVACAAPGTCMAAGSYTVPDGGVQGVLDTQSGGTWTAAAARLPSDAGVAKQYAFFESAACPVAGHCVAVGGYKIQNGSTRALIETAAPAGST